MEHRLNAISSQCCIEDQSEPLWAGKFYSQSGSGADSTRCGFLRREKSVLGTYQASLPKAHEATRELNDQVSTERRSEMSSLAPDANRAAEAVRGQWGIETSSHGVLEVVVGEEDSRVRVGNAPEKLALVRKLTHNWLQQEPTLKRGIQTQRLKAGWDRSDLLKILNVKPSIS